MKKVLVAVAVAVAAGVLCSSQAFADEAMAKAKGCTACHKVDAKLIRPAYKEVAKKYAGQAGAVDTLTQKVLDGGKGVWGPVAMTPNKGKVSPAEAKALVQWLLSLK